MNACTELVTTNGRPFSILEDSGFRKILNPLLEGLHPKITINIENIKKNISKIAEEERESLKRVLSGKLLLLKIDGATCLDRSILGINVQYIKADKIIIRTLAMKEMKEKHTSYYISSIILDVLKTYDLNVDMIYSITTDNGANMLKAVSVLSSYQNQIKGKETDEITDNLNENIDENGNNAGLQELMKTTEDVDNDAVHFLHIDHVPEILMTYKDATSILQGVRCAAHTLQLAVSDSIKEKNISHLISKARNVAKKLKTPIVMNILKKFKFKKPIIDCVSRWHSMHDMLERLLELRSFCDDMSTTIPELHLSSNDWNLSKLIVSALKPAKIGTKLFQAEFMTAGDFLGAWLKLKIDTDKVNTTFSKTLLKYMIVRENLLFESEAILTSIFLDPRYKLTLTEEQILKAKNNLFRTYETIKKLNKIDENLESQVDSNSSEEMDEVELLLKQNDKNAKSQSVSAVNIRAQIDSYWRESRIKKSECILKFWATKKFDYPDLYSIAVNVLAVPTTQVTVERAFSALKFILSPNRANLSEKMLADILYIRLNRQDL